MVMDTSHFKSRIDPGDETDIQTGMETDSESDDSDPKYIFWPKRITRTPYSEQWLIYEYPSTAIGPDDWISDGLLDARRVQPIAWLDLHFAIDRVEATLILVGESVYGDVVDDMSAWVVRMLTDDSLASDTIIMRTAYGKWIGEFCDQTKGQEYKVVSEPLSEEQLERLKELLTTRRGRQNL